MGGMGVVKRIVQAVIAVSVCRTACAVEKAPPTDVLFAIGTLFDGTDVAITRWGKVTHVNFGSVCSATFTDNGSRNGAATAASQWPPKCAPRCFTKGVSFEEEHGILHMSFVDSKCPEEAARCRINRWADEKTQHLIKDIDILYYETFAV